MSWTTWLRRVLKREGEDARELAQEIEQRLNADLDRRERELNATPEERLAATIEESAEVDAAFEEAARRIRDRATPDDPPGPA